MKTNPNDPAQPSTACEYINQSDHQPTVGVFGGLTKRETFAMTQMQALASRGEYGCSDASGDAEEAVRRADALIEALNKEEQ